MFNDALDVLCGIAMADQYGVFCVDDNQIFNTDRGDQAILRIHQAIAGINQDVTVQIDIAVGVLGGEAVNFSPVANVRPVEISLDNCCRCAEIAFPLLRPRALRSASSPHRVQVVIFRFQREYDELTI